MKIFIQVLILGAAVLSAGCASTTTYVSAPVGPSPGQQPEKAQTGVLQVYSARKEADVDLNKQAFFWNNDFGKNEFMYEAAHTDYNIYSEDGKLFDLVRNSHDYSDDQPAKVNIPAGTYKIEAEAEAGNVTTVKVMVPVVIKPGETTVVHLERDWKPSRKLAKEKAFVQVYDGRLIGWRAESSAVPIGQ